MSETREVSLDTLAEMVVEIDGLYRDIEWHRRVISHQTLSFRDGLSQRDDEIARLRDEVERLRLRTLNEGLQEENDDAPPNFCLPEEFRKGMAFATACAEEEIVPLWFVADAARRLSRCIAEFPHDPSCCEEICNALDTALERLA